MASPEQPEAPAKSREPEMPAKGQQPEAPARDSVESICNSLARFKVLDGERIRTLRGLWREQKKDGVDQPAQFTNWLVQTGYVTEFQLELLSRGLGDHLFLGEYKLVDRLARGRH